jgi:ubiquinone/menaquinone biosynthesis C-methylase UbiE
VKHAHPIVAAFYDRLLESTERAFLSPVRGRLLAAAHGRVLEIGAGTGRNFPHYLASVEKVVAVEPDPHMRRRAEARARTACATIRLAEGTAEALPVPSASFDVIVSTLVLCSVDDPDACVVEWRRVLKPGGEVLLVEHIRSDIPRRAKLQDFVTPLWKRLAANCHPNRSTLDTIRGAGFDFRETDRLALGPSWVQPIVAGIAGLR